MTKWGMDMRHIFKPVMIMFILAIVVACSQEKGGEGGTPASPWPDTPATHREAEDKGMDKPTNNTGQPTHTEAEDDAEAADRADEEEAGRINAEEAGLPMGSVKPTAMQAPFSLPDGYRIVEASAFTFAVPNDWQVEEGYFQDIFSFKFNGERIGEAEILGWFDAETWNNFKPNHSEQTDFREYSDLLVMDDTDVRVYKIQLTHTKPAAAQDPDWKYEETRWYVSVKENERSYGFYFDSEKIDEKVMETVVSSFRLKSVNRSTQE